MDVYGKTASVSTVLAGLMSAVAVVGARLSNNQHKVDQAWDWLKRIWIAWMMINGIRAFTIGGSKSTSEIFAGRCRMFGSMCFLMATNIVFFKMLLPVVSTVPSFPDVFLWMVLIVSLVKVAKKADEIITRIGLNPAIAGSRSSLPGVIAYTVFRTALSMVTKGQPTGSAVLAVRRGGTGGAFRPDRSSRKTSVQPGVRRGTSDAIRHRFFSFSSTSPKWA